MSGIISHFNHNAETHSVLVLNSSHTKMEIQMLNSQSKHIYLLFYMLKNCSYQFTHLCHNAHPGRSFYFLIQFYDFLDYCTANRTEMIMPNPCLSRLDATKLNIEAELRN